jgi:glucosamine kinase
MVFGLAGVGSEAIRTKLQSALALLLQNEGVNEQIFTIETDARIGLEGAFGGGSGVVMIAGTGSILIGKSSTEEVVRVGGWGRTLGDEGSGYWIGVEAIKAVARDLDGGPGAPFLRNVLAQKFGLTTRAEILDAVYQKKFEIPSIAPIVLEGAGAADPVCTAILHQGAHHLAAHLSVLVEKLGEAGTVGIVFVGGLIDHDTSYSHTLRDTITRTVPRADVRQALYSPAWGAVIMARKNTLTPLCSGGD